MKTLVAWTRRAVTLPSVQRCRQGLFNRPVALQAHQQALMLDAFAPRPLCQAQSDAFMGQPAGDRSVLLLLLGCSPTHIARFVIAGVVDSVQRISGRTPTHILKKCGVIIPAFAHANATCAITRKQLVIVALASRPHVLPSTPLDSARSMNGFAVLSRSDRFVLSHAISSLQEIVLVRGRRAVNALVGLAYFTAVVAV